MLIGVMLGCINIMYCVIKVSHFNLYTECVTDETHREHI